MFVDQPSMECRDGSGTGCAPVSPSVRAATATSSPQREPAHLPFRNEREISGIPAVTIDLLPAAVGYGDLIFAARLALSLMASGQVGQVRLLVESQRDLESLRRLYNDFPDFGVHHEHASWRGVEIYNGSYKSTTHDLLQRSKVCIVSQLMVVNNSITPRNAAVNLYVFEAGSKKAMGVTGMREVGPIYGDKHLEQAGSHRFCHTGFGSPFGLLYDHQKVASIRTSEERESFKAIVLTELGVFLGSAVPLSQNSKSAPWGILYPHEQGNCAIPRDYEHALTALSSREPTPTYTLFVIGSETTTEDAVKYGMCKHLIYKDSSWHTVAGRLLQNITVVHLPGLPDSLFNELLACGQLPAVVRSYNSFTDAVLANQMIMQDFPTWISGLTGQICEEAQRLLEPEDAARVCMILSPNTTSKVKIDCKAQSASRALEYFGLQRKQIKDILLTVGATQSTDAASKIYSVAAAQLRARFPDDKARLSREHLRLYHLFTLFEFNAANSAEALNLAERVLFSTEQDRYSNVRAERPNDLTAVMASSSFRESAEKFNRALTAQRDAFTSRMISTLREIADGFDQSNAL